MLFFFYLLIFYDNAIAWDYFLFKQIPVEMRHLYKNQVCYMHALQWTRGSATSALSRWREQTPCVVSETWDWTRLSPKQARLESTAFWMQEALAGENRDAVRNWASRHAWHSFGRNQDLRTAPHTRSRSRLKIPPASPSVLGQQIWWGLTFHPESVTRSGLRLMLPSGSTQPFGSVPWLGHIMEALRFMQNAFGYRPHIWGRNVTDRQTVYL